MKNRQLYWLTTPCNAENWFVLSTSKENAESFHDNGEGFNEGDSSAKLICNVPLELLKSHLDEDEDWWPYLELLKELGFKIIEENFPRIVSFKGKLYYEGRGYIQTLENLAAKNPGVYVINAIGTNRYKIGYSKNLNARLKAFRTALPYKIDLVFYVITKHHASLEKHLHIDFKDNRVIGEWFEFENEDISKVEAIFDYLNTNEKFEFINLKEMTRRIEI